MDDVDLCYLPATEALDAASAAEQRYHRGEAAGPLDGLPVGIKHESYIADKPTSNGSLTMEGFVADRSSTMNERILAAGGIVHVRAAPARHLHPAPEARAPDRIRTHPRMERVDPRGGHRLSRPSLRRVHLEAARRARRQDDELRACVRRVLPRRRAPRRISRYGVQSRSWTSAEFGLRCTINKTHARRRRRPGNAIRHDAFSRNVSTRRLVCGEAATILAELACSRISKE